MESKKIEVTETAITTETPAEKHEVLGRGHTRFTTPVDDPAFISEEKIQLMAAETPIEKSQLAYLDEPAFIPDLRKAQNYSQSGDTVEIDSMSQLSDEKPAIEHPVVSVVVNQEENSVTASYGGKTLIERNPGDWFVPGSFQVIQSALRLAWKTKFKEALPAEFQTSFSFNGGFSMGGKRNLFTSPWKPQKHVSKHAGGRSKKKKRK